MSEHHEGAVDHNISKLFPQKREEKPKTKEFYEYDNMLEENILIVDNFYEKPDDVRKFAFEQDFVEGGIGRGFIGRRTRKTIFVPRFKRKV